MLSQMASESPIRLKSFAGKKERKNASQLMTNVSEARWSLRVSRNWSGHLDAIRMRSNAREYTATVSLTNRTGVALELWVEPWGDFVAFPPQTTIRIVGSGTEPGEFEVAWDAQRATVYAWPTAVAQLFSEGVELKPGAFTSPVPAIPPGATISSFVRLMFGG
jgi:hypothetical protein